MVRAIMIVEIAGRPAEYVKESLEKHVGVLGKNKDIKVHSTSISEPKEIEVEGVPKGSEMFTCFSEVDFEVESFSRLSEIVFDFMPSSIEVIEPSKLVLDTNEASNLLNNIAGRMHRYDEIAKIAGARLQQTGAQLQAAQQALMDKDAGAVKGAEGKGKVGNGKKKAVKKKAVKKKAVKKKAVKVKGKKK